MNGSAETRLLLVDDDVALCRGLVDLLRSDGYEVDVAHDGEAGLEAARSGQHRIIVLDIMMPTMSGLEVLRQLRPGITTPVIMLTARDTDTDRILGLEFGADDYLAKPFNPKELLLRIKAILRRAEPESGEKLTVGALVLDTLNHQVSVGGRRLTLTGAELRALEMPMRVPGRVITRERLTEYALGRSLTPYDRSLHTHISNLRAKIGHRKGGQTPIRNMRGAGYVLIKEQIPES